MAFWLACSCLVKTSKVEDARDGKRERNMNVELCSMCISISTQRNYIDGCINNYFILNKRATIYKGDNTVKGVIGC